MNEESKTIYRAPHSAERPYFSISRASAQDRTLSFEARGLLLYLLSKPDDWEVQENDLKQQCGRDKVRGIVRELEEHGYLEREATRVVLPSGKTRFGPVFFRVHETPPTGFQLTGFQSTGIQSPENPSAIHNTESTDHETPQTIPTPDGVGSDTPPSAPAPTESGMDDSPVQTPASLKKTPRNGSKKQNRVENDAAAGPQASGQRAVGEEHEEGPGAVAPDEAPAPNHATGGMPVTGEGSESALSPSPSDNPTPLSGEAPEGPQSPPQVQAHIALIDAFFAALDEIGRKPVLVNYAKHCKAAIALVKAGVTVGQVKGCTLWLCQEDTFWQSHMPHMATVAEYVNLWITSHPAEVAVSATPEDEPHVVVQYICKEETLKERMARAEAWRLAHL